MKKTRNLLLTGVIIIFVIGMIPVVWNQRKTDTQKEDEKSQYLVGFSIHFMQDDYTVNVVNAFETIMKKNGVKTIIFNANRDSKKQVADIEDMINQNVDAIGICPLDDSAVRQSLIKAQKKGIKVVTITEIPGVEADAVIYGSEYENGYGSGKRLAKALKGQENAEVAVLDFPYDVDRTKERIRGFTDALAGTDIKITAKGRPGSNEETMDYIKDLLETNSNIKGVFGSYSNQVIGAGAACKALGRKDIVVVGVDADILVLKLIKEGWVLAVTAQFPQEHGEYCGQAILDQLESEKKCTIYAAPYQIVDQGNVTQMARRLWNKEL